MKHSLKSILFLMPLLIFIWQGRGVCRDGGEKKFPAVFAKGRYIAYTPRSFSVKLGQVTPATPSGIQEDLKTLRPCFDGIVTYSCVNGIEKVPEIAKKEGFRAVILGIWDPTSGIEFQNVMEALSRYPEMIAAVIVGNEGIYSARYQTKDVETAIKKIKASYPDLPVTTSEPFFLYLKPDYLKFFSVADFLAPNVHPVFEKWFTPENPGQGVTMVVEVADKIQSAYGKPILIKETGMPSGPESKGFSKERQTQFWKILSERLPPSPACAFVCFEAFDAPWKPAVMAETFPGDHASEAFWGFFSSDGIPKPVVKSFSSMD